MKKIYLLVILSAYLLNSCCDCSVSPISNPEFECLVREATVTQFNAELVNVDGELTPGTNYAIHNFVFPNSKYLSGTLVNDERFAKTGESIVSYLNYSNKQPYKIAILDNSPLNSTMIGDLLVLDVNTIDTTAELKVKGELALIDNGFLTDNAALFCTYIEASSDFIVNARTNLSLYGRNLQNSFVPRTYNQTNISILNKQNENVTGQQGVPAPVTADVTKLLELVNSNNVAIRVRAGDVYLYKSIAGDYFVILISDINTGILPPQKGRVSIMFNKVN